MILYLVLAYLAIGAIIGGYIINECNNPDSYLRSVLEKEKVDDAYDENKLIIFLLFTLLWLPGTLLTMFEK